MKRNLKGVSIIELLISFFLLTILGVIGTLSFLGYMSSVRDSSRVIQLHNIDAVFRGHNLRAGYYPEPTDFIDVLFSGSTVWKQGTFGNSVSDIIGYSRNVLDPLTNNQYTYSITNSKKEFSLAGVFEDGSEVVYDSYLFLETFAEGIGEKKGIAFVTGDYNGEVISLIVNGDNNILAIPSIISSDLSSNDLFDIITNNRLVYTDYENLPASYIGTKFDVNSTLDFSANTLIVYSGSISDLNKIDNQVALIQNVCNSYSGTLLGKKISISTVDKGDLFSVTPSKTVERVACDFVNFKVKYNIECP